ncbi:MAG: pyruvate carboxylase subunit B, partial [Bacteroidota bacterium]
LLRGQNLVGYKNYPDDLLERFIETAIRNGIDIFRIFDALNDTRNLEAAIKFVKKYGAHAQGTLSYTLSPVHTVEKYVAYAKEQVQLGIDSLCIKDMAGILSPVRSQQLVSALTKEIDIPIQVHCHSTSGMAQTAYFEGVKAGAGAIDCASTSMAGFSSQPPVETIVAMFEELNYDLSLDGDALRKINKYFADLTPSRTKGRKYEPYIDSEILVHQIPGGMISNFRSQLEQQDALEKLPEALEEVTKVREDLGFPPLVTPTSQIVGTQAVMNVLTGERYKIVPQEVKNYVKGMYGLSPNPIKKEFIKKILGDEKPINHRPADDLQPILPDVMKNVSNPKLIKGEEDILSYCLFPEIATEYFHWRELPEDQRPLSPADREVQELEKINQYQKDAEKYSANGGALPSETSLDNDIKKMLHKEDYDGISSLMDKASKMQLNELVIRKGDFNFAISTGSSNGSTMVLKTQEVAPVQHEPVKETKQVQTDNQVKSNTSVEKNIPPSGDTIDSVMAGTFYRASGENAPPFVVEGTEVKKGDIICILEAMKLFNEIQAPFDCKINRILVENAAKVTKGQPIMEVEKL